MAIKSKSRLILVLWALLLALGLSGILTALTHGSEYINRTYFQSQQFEGELNQFLDYLSAFELNKQTKEEAQKAITVTPEEIKEYRYRYGDLGQQVENIKGQYEAKIQEALISKNQGVAQTYIAERDKKIEDITNNFKSDDYVRAKIISEKESNLEKYFNNLESYRAYYLRYTGVFKYYFKETTTGAVYTNLSVSDSSQADKLLNTKDMLFVRSYPGSRQDYITPESHLIDTGNIEAQKTLRAQKAGIFEGNIAIPKLNFQGSLNLAGYNEFLQKQKLIYIYVICAILALGGSFLLGRKGPVAQFIANEEWLSFYNWIPFDVRVVSLSATGLISLLLLIFSMDRAVYFQDEFFYRGMAIILALAAFFIALTFIQVKLLVEALKSSGLKVEWQKSLLSRTNQSLKEAFLNRRIGTQVFVLLAVVFAFGAGAIVVLAAPPFILIYVPALALVGLPIIRAIIKNTGYFNLIVNNIGEMAKGNSEQDIPITGKSVLTGLAADINALRHGVKKSQREQAKSERLKTELITNVSHDLRTPLTSIITYTELLKTPDLTKEDHEAYIQIIDRKSKRLKILIDDLFEASKMASGNIELIKEKVDLVQLLQQALAEHDETISKSTLQFRVTTQEPPINAVVDGQKMWRVFDNLIGNILKYSLENTRVYVAIKSTPGKVLIAFKNVTKYELGQDIDELFERFKRGDTSRHTDGSGLGLAIAKSIVDLHGGTMDIDLDGDLFKVTITLDTGL